MPLTSRCIGLMSRCTRLARTRYSWKILSWPIGWESSSWYLTRVFSCRRTSCASEKIYWFVRSIVVGKRDFQYFFEGELRIPTSTILPGTRICRYISLRNSRGRSKKKQHGVVLIILSDFVGLGFFELASIELGFVEASFCFIFPRIEWMVSFVHCGRAEADRLFGICAVHYSVSPRVILLMDLSESDYRLWKRLLENPDRKNLALGCESRPVFRPTSVAGNIVSICGWTVGGPPNIHHGTTYHNSSPHPKNLGSS